MDPDSLRALARVCPKLRLLRLGGSIKASKAAAEALPDIVPPSVLATDRQAASWEDTFSGLCWLTLVHMESLWVACVGFVGAGCALHCAAGVKR